MDGQVDRLQPAGETPPVSPPDFRTVGVQLGDRILAADPEVPDVLFGGTVRALAPELEQLELAVEWRSDGAPVLVGSARRIFIANVYPPAEVPFAFRAARDEAAEITFAETRVQAILTLWGLWAVYNPDTKAEVLRDLSDALEITLQERGMAIYAASIARDADENGVEPQPGGELAVPIHEQAEHARWGGCRYCNPRVAAAYRASHGRVKGISVRAVGPEGGEPK